MSFRYASNGSRVSNGTRITRIVEINNVQMFYIMVDEKTERFSQVYWDDGGAVDDTPIIDVTPLTWMQVASENPDSRLRLGPGVYDITTDGTGQVARLVADGQRVTGQIAIG